MLVITVVGADAITLVKQFTAAGLQPKVHITFFGFSENYLAGLTNAESDGIVTISNFISSLDKPEAKAFVKKVRDRYGANTIVSNTTDAHYNLVRFYFGGIRKAEQPTRRKSSPRWSTRGSSPGMAKFTSERPIGMSTLT